ncbi:XRE family transcriptional regulator [Sphingobium yanoikuyae]|uniref:Helix-turn-helix domain-containing protein n=1 Tax=Sphingobium yanoikuyae TaxID=13690 RepID=A0A9X7UE27_SPHYA|nr:LexA family transcriptional regulator [Sphingobium yanoikuyae]QNG44685.1 helix-turn-helix domain-containing protein [Sphingobium yanoikuyae]
MENFIRQIRKSRNMSQQDLAEIIGIGVPQVSRIESGKTDISLSRLRQIAEALNCQISDLMTFDQFAGISISPDSNAVAVKMEGASEERMREDLPVFGTALGAPKVVEGESIEQTTLNSGEVIQYVKRPVILNGRADAYGLYVQGGSMAPVHLEGDMLLAETKRPARIGDDAVVYLRPKNEDDDGERARSVLVKRLVRRTASYVELEQFNPPVTFRIDATEILRIDRVMRLTDLIA